MQDRFNFPLHRVQPPDAPSPFPQRKKEKGKEKKKKLKERKKKRRKKRKKRKKEEKNKGGRRSSLEQTIHLNWVTFFFKSKINPERRGFHTLEPLPKLPAVCLPTVYITYPNAHQPPAKWKHIALIHVPRSAPGLKPRIIMYRCQCTTASVRLTSNPRFDETLTARGIAWVKVLREHPFQS